MGPTQHFQRPGTIVLAHQQQTERMADIGIVRLDCDCPPGPVGGDALLSAIADGPAGIHAVGTGSWRSALILPGRRLYRAEIWPSKGAAAVPSLSIVPRINLAKVDNADGMTRAHRNTLRAAMHNWAAS
jgi:hypothetical protein